MFIHLILKILGVYHFQQKSEISRREVPFGKNAFHFRSQASLCSSNLPRKLKMAVPMLMLHENLEFSIDEESLTNSEDDGEINIL